MPELPEVETIVRGLRTVLPGHTIVSVRLGKTDFIEEPLALAELLPGRRIETVERPQNPTSNIQHPASQPPTTEK